MNFPAPLCIPVLDLPDSWLRSFGSRTFDSANIIEARQRGISLSALRGRLQWAVFHPRQANRRTCVANTQPEKP